jgi:organic hydroperoxide reductase OsmC/OhrA
MEGQTAKPKREYKVHTFRSSLAWTGDRTWDVTHETAVAIQGGPPAVFMGEPGKWSSEELLLASVNSCVLATFVSYCARKRFEFVSYTSDVEGVLEHDGTNYKYSRITLRPRITVKSAEDVEPARHYIERAHDLCFMSYSVKAEVTVEPEIIVVE